MNNEFWLRFLRWFCPAELYEGIEGDLLEQHEVDLKKSPTLARRRFARNTLKFFRPEIIFRNKFSLQLLNTIMIANYFKVASRNILKRKLYSFINAFGLSIGIAFCVLVYLFIQDEKSFDQFHANKDLLFRIHVTSYSRENVREGKEPYQSHPYLPAGLGEVMRDELAEVESMSRYIGTEVVMRYKDKIFKEDNFVYVDSGFFKMFSFKIVQGSARKLFHNQHEIVITQAIAKKYFGDEDPIGKQITVDSDGGVMFTVAAVTETPPSNSSIDFQVLAPIASQKSLSRNREQWGNFSYPTFVMLHPGTQLPQFKTHLDTLTQKYMGSRFKKWREREQIPAQYKVGEFGFMNIQDIHMNTLIEWKKSSDPRYSVILGGIGGLILLIACINYISLSLTTSASRRIEVGIRKVVGAQKKQIVNQFWIEAIVLSLISTVIGLGLVALFLPAFEKFTNKAIPFSLLTTVQVTGVSVLVALFVGVLAGSYPAIFLARFLPARVLKGNLSSKMVVGFTKPLVVLQFALSAFLIISSVVMYQQMNFITTKDLGYQKEQVIVIPAQSGWSDESDKVVERFKNKLKQNPAVVASCGTSSSFNHGWSRYGYRIKDENKSAFVYSVDCDYIPFLGLELVAGRAFDERIASDSTGVIVNEALVKDMGWKDPLNEYLNWREDSTGLGSKVIGVLKDYHYLSLEQAIEPMFISIDKNLGHLTTVMVRLTPGDLAQKTDQIKKAWIELNPDKPFDFTFLDQDVASQYDSYQRWMSIMGLATGFAILISCLGLFGLAGINAVNKTKEIGIRKVMGAELSNIFILLNRQYIGLSIIAFVLAAPLSWFVMNKWLADFKFRIVMGWELFAFSMIAGLIVALVTVSFHAFKAATVNPAETLKCE